MSAPRNVNVPGHHHVYAGALRALSPIPATLTLLPDRLKAGRLVLVQVIGVRISVREPGKNHSIAVVFSWSSDVVRSTWVRAARNERRRRGCDRMTPQLSARQGRAHPCPGTKKISHRKVAVFLGSRNRRFLKIFSFGQKLSRQGSSEP